MIHFVYSKGDFTKIGAEFFEKALDLLGNQKVGLGLKAELCYLTGAIFRAFWQRTVSPPTKELIELSLKIYKLGASEKHVKLRAIGMLKHVVKASPMNLL
jgi:hypothetical protein